MRGMAKWFRFRLSVAGPEAPPLLPTCDPEKNLMPTPTHPWHQDHNDEQAHGFQGEGCNDPRQIGSKPKDMENGIKSPSLRMGRGSAQQHLNPPPLQAVDLSSCAGVRRVSIPLERGWPEGTPAFAHMRS